MSRCATARPSRRPACLPTLISSTGLQRAAARSALMKRRAILDALDIEEDVLGLGVGDQVVEDLAEIDVGRSAPSETTVEKPTLFGCAQSRMAVHSAPDCETRPMVPGLALPWAKVRLTPAARAHDAEAVGADQAHAVAPRGIDHGALERGAARPAFGEAAGDDDDIARAGAAAGLDDAGHGLGPWCRSPRDRGAAGCSRPSRSSLAENRFVLRIDAEELALVAAVQHVADEVVPIELGVSEAPTMAIDFGSKSGVR